MKRIGGARWQRFAILANLRFIAYVIASKEPDEGEGNVCGIGIVKRVVLAAALLTIVAPEQVSASALLSAESLARHGLVRAWARQVQLDRSRDRVSDLVLAEGLLLVKTRSGVVHALDAESGRTMWTIQVPGRNLVGFAPAANGKFVAVVQGLTLYVVNRADGKPAFEAELSGSPSAGAAVSDQWAYVPMQDGRIMAFKLDEPDGRPWLCRGTGTPEVPPVVTPTSLVWGTSRGFVYSNDLDKSGIRFELSTGGPVATPLASRPPAIYVVSDDHFVYALDETTGAILWRFATGSPIRQQPVAIGDSVYVIPIGQSMHCLAAATGDEKWSAPHCVQFVAASGERIYVTDGIGRTWILDAATGARLAAISTELLPHKLVNIETDRIYLATPTGMVQCLHESALVEPLNHKPPIEEPAEEKPADRESDAEKPAGDQRADETRAEPAAERDNADAPPAAEPQP